MSLEHSIAYMIGQLGTSYRVFLLTTAGHAMLPPPSMLLPALRPALLPTELLFRLSCAGYYPLSALFFLLALPLTVLLKSWASVATIQLCQGGRQG